MRYLVTSALPYANGPVHFGHIAGAYLPADIFVRYKRLRREEILFICGTDEHGTPITFSAQAEGIAPLAYADRYHEVIKGQFERLAIEFDNFSRTTLPLHHELTQQLFLALLKNGYIFEKIGPALFCPSCKKGLADRFVVGTCYVCGFDRARGDECQKCGTALDALRLADPRCKTCGTPAQKRDTPNWFVDLPKLRPKIDPYLTEAFTRWKESVKGEVNKYWTDLRPWVITRDLDWGVRVPLETEDARGKVFYVWFDAPIGYISSTIEWAEKRGKKDSWRDWWLDRKNTRLIHFIGKDNIVFHTLRWPAVLLGQDEPYLVPHDVPANEFYNLEGAKWSKGEGWYIDFFEFLEKYPADALRWTIARGAPETKDSEFTWKDFQAKVNAELLGNFGNFASRVLKFVKEKLGGNVPQARAPLVEHEAIALAKAQKAHDEIGRELDRYGVRAACERLLEIGAFGNKLLEQREPWKTLKTEPDRCATTLNVAVKILEVLSLSLFPFCPRTAEKLWKQLGLDGKVTDRAWSEPAPDPAGRALGEIEHVFKKVEDEEVAREVAALRARAAERAQKETRVDEPKKPDATSPASPATPGAAKPAAPAPPAKPADGPKGDIAFEDFAKLDIKIAKVLTCAPVAGADKLYQLEIEIEGGAKRTVVSGIRPWYQETDLVGREVVYLANLAPKKIRGAMSQGMILAARTPDGGAILLKPEKTAFPGSKVS
ncbi:methionine--tRNA ligase [bacterium]|nr:methionine--tRNA ligase [bacterium]